MIKHTFYTNDKNLVTCVSHYAGKRVVGTAKCNTEEDTFDLARGMELAAARCDVKVLEKRVKRATQRAQQRTAEVEKAEDALRASIISLGEARTLLEEANVNLCLLERTCKRG